MQNQVTKYISSWAKGVASKHKNDCCQVTNPEWFLRTEQTCFRTSSIWCKQTLSCISIHVVDFESACFFSKHVLIFWCGLWFTDKRWQKRISGPGEKPAQTHSQVPQGAKISLFKRKHVCSDPENKATIAAYDCINKNCIIYKYWYIYISIYPSIHPSIHPSIYVCVCIYKYKCLIIWYVVCVCVYGRKSFARKLNFGNGNAKKYTSWNIEFVNRRSRFFPKRWLKIVFPFQTRGFCRN
jgi:hypothetical protein